MPRTVAASRTLLTRPLFHRYCLAYQHMLFAAVLCGEPTKCRAPGQWAPAIERAVSGETGHVCAALAARNLGFTMDQVRELPDAVPFIATVNATGRLLRIRLDEASMWRAIVHARQ